jgi:hypothetical protein
MENAVANLPRSQPLPASLAYPHDPRGRAGIVLQELDHRFLIREGRTERWATRAVSCLVHPEEGDEVLLATLDDGRTFLLAVLTRSATTATTLSTEGDLRIAPRGGACAIHADQGVTLESPAHIQLRAGSLALQAQAGQFLFGKVSALANSLVARLNDAQVSGTTLATVAEQITQTARRCLRKVTELDQLRADRADWRTEKELTLRAENLLTGIRKLAKIDAKQVHIG